VKGREGRALIQALALRIASTRRSRRVHAVRSSARSLLLPIPPRRPRRPFVLSPPFSRRSRPQASELSPADRAGPRDPAAAVALCWPRRDAPSTTSRFPSARIASPGPTTAVALLAPGLRTDEHGSDLRHCLKPRAVHGVPPSPPSRSTATGPDRRSRRSRSRPRPHAEASTPAARPTVPRECDRRVGLQASENRTLWIVFPWCAWSAEQREEPSSLQILDGSPVPFDDLTEVADRATDDLTTSSVEFRLPAGSIPATSAGKKQGP
jgi:hypothetical protein